MHCVSGVAVRLLSCCPGLFQTTDFLGNILSFQHELLQLVHHISFCVYRHIVAVCTHCCLIVTHLIEELDVVIWFTYWSPATHFGISYRGWQQGSRRSIIGFTYALVCTAACTTAVVSNFTIAITRSHTDTTHNTAIPHLFILCQGVMLLRLRRRTVIDQPLFQKHIGRTFINSKTPRWQCLVVVCVCVRVYCLIQR